MLAHKGVAFLLGFAEVTIYLWGSTYPAFRLTSWNQSLALHPTLSVRRRNAYFYSLLCISKCIKIHIKKRFFAGVSWFLFFLILATCPDRINTRWVMISSQCFLLFSTSTMLNLFITEKKQLKIKTALKFSSYTSLNICHKEDLIIRLKRFSLELLTCAFFLLITDF